MIYLQLFIYQRMIIKLLKEKVAIQLVDGSWPVFIGLKACVDNFITSLKQQAKSEEITEDDESHPLSSVDSVIVSKKNNQQVSCPSQAVIEFFRTIDKSSWTENYAPLLLRLSRQYCFD